MRPFYTEHFGNPSSGHRLGDRPAEALRDARARLAAFLGCADTELIFTSCGTESDNLAIRGVVDASREKRHLITTRVEHSAVFESHQAPRVVGLPRHLSPRRRSLGPPRRGRASRPISDDTALISIMFANNETGVMHPIHAHRRDGKSCNVPLHGVDAVQGIGNRCRST